MEASKWRNSGNPVSQSRGGVFYFWPGKELERVFEKAINLKSTKDLR
jgi:hypothetical protein